MLTAVAEEFNAISSADAVEARLLAALQTRYGIQKMKEAAKESPRDLARRLTVVLNRMWRDGSVFQPQHGEAVMAYALAQPDEIRDCRGAVSLWGRG